MAQDKYSYKSDCRHFRGHIPCKPHKEYGVHCIDCKFYDPVKFKLLIIKLGAIGDVIRTTPLLHRIKIEYPEAEIWWLTHSPEIVPSSVDKILDFNERTTFLLKETEFEIVYNLDKDDYACALAGSIKTKELYGFMLKDGKPEPANELAEHKFITGIFDDANRENRKNYLEEMFEIAGWKYNGEDYILDEPDSPDIEIPSDGKIIAGLNTGCGARWISRLWKEEYWEELINKLDQNGYFPLLLGGEQEHEKNLRLSENTGAFYPGLFPLKKFISLMDKCDIVVTAVTMALHIAIGLKKKVILMNNIFNPNEFELYGRGEIVQPDKECKCFFLPECKNEEYFCMDYLKPDKIIKAVKRHVKQ